MIDDRVGGDLTIGAGSVEDEAGMVSLRGAAAGEYKARRARGASGGGADSADLVESRADVDRLAWSQQDNSRDGFG